MMEPSHQQQNYVIILFSIEVVAQHNNPKSQVTLRKSIRNKGDN